MKTALKCLIKLNYLPMLSKLLLDKFIKMLLFIYFEQGERLNKCYMESVEFSVKM